MTEKGRNSIEELGNALQEPTRMLAEAAKSGDLQAMQVAAEARMREVLVFASSEENLDALIKQVGGKPLSSQQKNTSTL